jgi:hypothetical protein
MKIVSRLSGRVAEAQAAQTQRGGPGPLDSALTRLPLAVLWERAASLDASVRALSVISLDQDVGLGAERLRLAPEAAFWALVTVAGISHTFSSSPKGFSGDTRVRMGGEMSA